MFDLKGKVALVTGGARGIGLEYVKEFLKNGLKGVTVVDIDEEQGKVMLKEIETLFGYGKAIFVKANVVDALDVKNAFDKTVEVFNQFDILVNNAGIVNELNWEKCLNVNILSVMKNSMLAIQNYFPKYKSTEEGIILNVSSCSVVFPIDGFNVYDATKQAILGFTKAFGLATQNAFKVRVVCVCPFATETAMNQFKSDQLSERFISIYKESWKEFNFQPPEIVARAGIKLIKEGKTGTAWSVKDGEAVEIGDARLVDI